MKKRTYIPALLIMMLASTWTACDKLLDIPPPDESVVFEDALNTTEDMQSLLNSCYDVMANAYYGEQQNLSELLSDNLDAPYNHNDYNEVYIFHTIFFNGTIGSFYEKPYIAIMRVNSMFENFDRINDLTPETKLRFEAEGHFIRAVNHYEVLQLFAQPWGYTPDNSHLGIAIRDHLSFDPVPRATVKQVYDFVINDLKFAEENLPDNNVINGVPYADKWAAKAMLARVYFQMNDFEKAAQYAGEVINSGRFALAGLNDRWSQDISSENIFTLIVELNDNRSAALIGNYRSDNNDLPTLRVTRDYFENLYVDGENATPNDARKDWFVIKDGDSPNYFYAVTRFNADYLNIPFLHLTEMLLIHAESLAELNMDLGTAVNDLNMIKERAGIGLLGEGTTADVIIKHARLERKKEMIAEGRYAYDLKRRGAKGEDITVRGAPWNCPGMILQFPNSENTSNFIMNETGGCN